MADFMKYSSDRGILLVDMTEEEIAAELETIRRFASKRG